MSAPRPYSPGNLAPRVPYDPDLIDYFFVIDGDFPSPRDPRRDRLGVA
jgi:hypothetical protein